MAIEKLIKNGIQRISDNLLFCPQDNTETNQTQVKDSYSYQWEMVYSSPEKLRAFERQKRWYLELYGFGTEAALAKYLQQHSVILDAGCGLGYKAAWFSELAPDSTVLAMDISAGVEFAAKHFSARKNLLFIKGDIANTYLEANCVNYVSCDQVLQHTENPEATLTEFNRILHRTGELAIYVYRKKALPRELLDTHFRSATHDISREDIKALSQQLTQLGRQLSELKIELDFPDMPLLGIEGGKQDLQRFIYWNFIKCFWNEELGEDISVATNFDWYSPSSAQRYSYEEFQALIADAGFELRFTHTEEACYSGIARLVRKV